MLDDEAAAARTALEEARASGDVDRLAAVIHAHLWPLYDRHIGALHEAVSSVSGQSLAKYPILRMLHPMAPALAGSSSPFDARTLGEVEMATETGRDALLTMQVLATRMSGDVHASVEYARALSDRVYNMHVPERAQRGSILWFLHYEIGSALLLSGDSAGAVRELTNAREVGRHSGSPDAERVSLVRLALAEVLRGSVGDAETALETGRALPPLSGPYKAQGASTEAVAASLISLERGIQRDSPTPPAPSHLESTAFTWAFVALARARYFLISGRPTDALEAARVAAATHRVQDGTLPADILTRIYVETFLVLGHEQAAVKAAQSPREPGPMVKMAMARLELARGDFDAARTRIQRLAAAPSMSPANESELVCLRTWEAAAREGAGPDTARRFLSVVQNPDSRRIALMTPRWVVDAIRTQMPDELREEFASVVAGLPFPEIGRSALHLTASELRVLSALPNHERVVDLASALFLSPNTVKTHLSSLYRKLGVSSRREAIEARTLLRLEVDDEESDDRAG